jgi:hypothetical protein
VLSNKQIAKLAVGSLVLIFLYRGLAGPTPTHSSGSIGNLLAAANAIAIKPEVPVDNTEQMIIWAKEDPVKLFNWMLDNYKKHVQDFKGTFTKQERVNGKLKKEQVISFMFKEEPFSVIMEWEKNAGSIDKLLYVEKQDVKDNKMLVHPTGLLSWIKSVERDPHCDDVYKTSRKPCDRFGFGRMMEDLIKVYALAKQQDDLQTKYLGKKEINGRKCILIERTLPPKEEYPCKKMVAAIDLEYLVPIYVTSYDWQDELVSRYEYTNLQFNVGLRLAQFTAKANKL